MAVMHAHTTPCFALTPSKVDVPDAVGLEAFPSLASFLVLSSQNISTVFSEMQVYAVIRISLL